MGKDKSLLPFQGFESLCEYQLSRLKPLFSSVYVSAKEDKFSFDVNLIVDKGDTFSPMVALKSILSHFEDKMLFIISVDTPFVGKNQIAKMYSFIDKYEIIIPQTAQKKHYLCGFYHTKLKRNCEKLLRLDQHKISLLQDKTPTKIVDFEDEEAFTNLNHPEDYTKANI